MAERAQRDEEQLFPRTRTFGTAAATARSRFAWAWSRESVFRLALSLVLATALWLYVTQKQDPTIAWHYPQGLPVTAANVPDGTTISNTLPSVHATLRVDSRTTPVTPSSLHVFVDLHGLRPGTHARVPVQVVSDPGIQVVQIRPSHLAVILEPIARIHVPVKWQVLAPPPAGYSAGQVRIDPSTVTISGPQSVVSQVVETTVYVYLSQARSSMDEIDKPTPINGEGQPVSGRLLLDPPEVSVVVPVHANSSYKSLPVLVPITGQPKPGFGVVGVTSSPAEVTAFGSPSKLGAVSSVTTGAVSVAHRGAGAFTRRISLKLPRGIQANAKMVRVTIQLAPVSASSSIQIGVSPENISPGMVARMLPATVLATVAGPSGAVRRAATSMRAVINLSGYTPGTYQLAPQIIAPRGLKVLGVYPSTVTVVVTSSAG